MATDTKAVMEKIVALCKRRGFIFQSSEIYGGIAGFWDYGPLGTELKRNIKDAWWNDMVQNPPIGPRGKEFQMVGVDCSIIMNPKVWEASGHVGGFSDPMVDCKECKARFRADQFSRLVIRQINSVPKTIDDLRSHLEDVEPKADILAEDHFSDPQEYTKQICSALRIKKPTFEALTISGYAAGGSGSLGILTSDKNEQFSYRQVPVLLDSTSKYRCPRCNGELTEPRQFNLMFQTYVGALQDASCIAYLRPETAQGIFANFKNVMDSSRVRIPFGIAQIGKSFRNEINPRNYTFRSREFEQMEIEFFCTPEEHCTDDDVTPMEWYEFWRDVRIKWYESLNIKSDKLRPRQQEGDELAHYSKACTDIEYLFPFSDETQELEGVAHRGCYDLSQHGKHAKGKEDGFSIYDDERKAKYVPHVIEPSAGADRFTLATICEAYTVDESRPSPEFMRFHPRLAPIKAAVFPLVAKDGMPEIAEPIFREIKKLYPAQFDSKQSIGKRYARMDEAGTPYCFTIDGQTKEDNTITVRDRDTGEQTRISKESVGNFLREKLSI